MTCKVPHSNAKRWGLIGNVVKADRYLGPKSTTAPATVSGERCLKQPLWKHGKARSSQRPASQETSLRRTVTHAVGSGGEGDQYEYAS